jgi:hypothetical protein
MPALALVEDIVTGGNAGLLTVADAGVLPFITTAELGALLQHDSPLEMDAMSAAYDGHIAFALDLGTLTGLDAALDGLTSSHLLFDVPAIDVGFAGDVGLAAGDGVA